MGRRPGHARGDVVGLPQVPGERARRGLRAVHGLAQGGRAPERGRQDARRERAAALTGGA